MDWFKQNKFIAGWLLVTLIGVGLLGFLFMSAKGAYAEASDAYTAKVSELQTMQNATPYPDEENFKKMQELQKAHQAAIDDLQTRLAKTEFPVVPMTAVKFQDELRETVRRVTAAAAAKSPPVSIPEKFYMGFERYQAEPPKDEAAAPLGRLLKAMEEAVNVLIEAGPDSIADIKREPLPEEGSDKAAAAQPPQPGKPGKDKDKENDLVKRTSIDLSFIASEPRFRRFLNDIIADPKQFYIPKNVSIKNEKLTGPPKTAPDGNVPKPDDKEKGGVVFVVGSEKLTVGVRLDIVDFAEPSK
jgi:hypothetical protein